MAMTRTTGTRHRVWLHIGMPKTGTTSIQSVMFFNGGLLRDHGYFYPDFGDRQHVALARELSHRAGSRIPFPMNGNAGPWRRFSELLDRQPAPLHTSIISSENFFQRPACVPGHCGSDAAQAFGVLKATVEEVAEYFADCDVTVIAWLRRQDNWLMSMYNETIKTSLYSRGFHAFAEQSIGAHMAEIVKLWVDAFGRERVICRSYDGLTRRRENIVDSFLATVCPDVPREGFRKREESRNLSLSAEGLWLKRRINLVAKAGNVVMDEPAQARIRALLVDVTQSSADPRAQWLGTAERKKLMGRYREENEALVKGMGYAELEPLLDLSDLEDAAVTAAELTLGTHVVDRMIKTFVLPVEGGVDGLEQPTKEGRSRRRAV